MATVTISLSAPLHRFVDAQMATGLYRSVSEYISVLVLQDQKRQAQAQLRAFCEAANDDVAIDMAEDDWHLWP